MVPTPEEELLQTSQLAKEAAELLWEFLALGTAEVQDADIHAPLSTLLANARVLQAQMRGHISNYQGGNEAGRAPARPGPGPGCSRFPLPGGRRAAFFFSGAGPGGDGGAPAAGRPLGPGGHRSGGARRARATPRSRRRRGCPCSDAPAGRQPPLAGTFLCP